MIKIKVGDRFETNCGPCIVVDYVNALEIWVRFLETNYETKCEAGQLRKGNVKDRYYRSVFDVGYVGEGPYNKKDTPKQYQTWYNMLNRCYSPKYHLKFPTYKDCYASKHFHSLQDFSYWYDNQYCSNLEGNQLDKDLLVKHNKIYGPKRAIVIPHQVNSLLVKRDGDRGKYLIGVYKRKDNLKRPYVARCNTTHGRKAKCFNTEINAYNWYKKTKEQNIKDAADLYKDVLDPRAYQALLNYKVELTD